MLGWLGWTSGDLRVTESTSSSSAGHQMPSQGPAQGTAGSGGPAGDSRHPARAGRRSGGSSSSFSTPPRHPTLTGPQAELVCGPGWCEWGRRKPTTQMSACWGAYCHLGALWELGDLTHFIDKQRSQVKLTQPSAAKAGGAWGIRSTAPRLH